MALTWFVDVSFGWTAALHQLGQSTFDDSKTHNPGYFSKQKAPAKRHVNWGPYARAFHVWRGRPPNVTLPTACLGGSLCNAKQNSPGSSEKPGLLGLRSNRARITNVTTIRVL